MDVGHSLRFHALRSVDDKKRAFTGGQAAGDFVSEINMAGGVEQVEAVFLAVFRAVAHRDRMGFDRDPALALEIHRIEQLILLIAGMNGARPLEQTV
jgi:hypothetical protein